MIIQQFVQRIISNSIYTSSHFAGGISGNFIWDMLGDRSVLFRRRVEEPAGCSVALKSNVFSDAIVEEPKLKSAQTSLLFFPLKS